MKRLTKQDLEIIEQATAILDTELKLMTIQEISKRLFVSEMKLAAIFKQKQKCTLSKYHLLKRMAYAKDQLENKGAMVKEVSNALGYSDPHNFNHAFKKIYKNPPGSFKEYFYD